MANYTFTFPAAAAGKAVTVRDAVGDSVDTGTVGAASSAQGVAVYATDLPAGDYVAEAVDTKIYFSSRAAGVLVNASFVDNADDSDAASVAAAVDALRDALIDAGFMASE